YVLEKQGVCLGKTGSWASAAWAQAPATAPPPRRAVRGCPGPRRSPAKHVPAMWFAQFETNCLAGHIGLELRCAKLKFISLSSRQCWGLPTPAQTVLSYQKNNFLFQFCPRRRCPPTRCGSTAGVARRRLRAGQGNQLRLTLAIEDRLNRRRLAFLP